LQKHRLQRSQGAAERDHKARIYLEVQIVGTTLRLVGEG
jgi:hypothetical protein